MNGSIYAVEGEENWLLESAEIVIVSCIAGTNTP